MSGPWAGVDVGGTRKGFHVAIVDHQGVVTGPCQRKTVAETVDWLAPFGPVMTAVDSPIGPAPDGRHVRECERRLRAEICGIRWTPDRATLQGNRGYYGWILHGFELFRALERAGLATIECFPTASWTRWERARDGRTRAAWTRGVLAALPLAGVPGRTNQDDRDAIAAALTARDHGLGRADRFGEIVVPKAPTAYAPSGMTKSLRERA